MDSEATLLWLIDLNVSISVFSTIILYIISFFRFKSKIYKFAESSTISFLTMIILKYFIIIVNILLPCKYIVFLGLGSSYNCSLSNLILFIFDCICFSSFYNSFQTPEIRCPKYSGMNILSLFITCIFLTNRFADFILGRNQEFVNLINFISFLIISIGLFKVLTVIRKDDSDDM